MVRFARAAVHDPAGRDRAHGMPPQCQAPAGAAVHYALAQRLHCPRNGEILDSSDLRRTARHRPRTHPSPGRPRRFAARQCALRQVMSSSVDSADLYFQLSREESWALEDGIVKEGSASIEQGVGVRAVAGEKTGFAYSDEIVLPALEEASRAARAIAMRGTRSRDAERVAHERPQSLSTHRSGVAASPPARRSPGSSAWIARPARWIRASSRSWRAWLPCTRWC